jgi:hypothetical protein
LASAFALVVSGWASAASAQDRFRCERRAIDGDTVVECRESGSTACSGECFERPGAFCLRAWRPNGDAVTRCGASHADCVAHRSIEYRAGRTESTSCVWSVPSQPSPLAAPVTTLFFCATNGQCFRSEGECYRDNDACSARASGWCLDGADGVRRCFTSRAACATGAPSPTVAARCVERRRFVDSALRTEHTETRPATTTEPSEREAAASESSERDPTAPSAERARLASVNQRLEAERARVRRATLDAQRERREAQRLRARRARTRTIMMRRR